MKGAVHATWTKEILESRLGNFSEKTNRSLSS